MKARLDYETQPQLSFTVVAHDTGVPTLSATATVIVQVTVYTTQLHTHGGSITICIKIKCCKVPEDFYIHKILYRETVVSPSNKLVFIYWAFLSIYHILSLKQTQHYFFPSIKHSSCTSQTLDFSWSVNLRIFPFSFQLENINDEEPVFSASVYDAEVAENSPPGTSVIAVTARDADEGDFGVISYSLAGWPLYLLHDHYYIHLFET